MYFYFRIAFNKIYTSNLYLIVIVLKPELQLEEFILCVECGLKGRLLIYANGDEYLTHQTCKQ